MNARFKGKPNMICSVCGKPYHIYPSEKSKGERKYCSWTCYGKKRNPFPGDIKKHTKNPNTTCIVCGKPHYCCPKYILEGKRKRHHCSRSCFIKSLLGSANPNWKGGEKPSPIKWVKSPKAFRPMTRKNAQIPEHRLVMAQHLGRFLRSEEVVHHKNGIRNDNRIENLELLTGRGEHNRLHWKQDKRAPTQGIG